MNKLSKAQRDKLLGIVVGTLAIVGALYYFVVTTMDADLATTRKNTQDKRDNLYKAEQKIAHEAEFSATLHKDKDMLDKIEAGLVPDQDAYAWLVTTMTAFIQSRKGVNIDSYGGGKPEITEDGLIPKFPYRWATFHLRGTGYYQDLGKFFADFENAFPYFRIQNPTLTVNSGPGMEPEKLSVTFDIVAPVMNSGTEIK